ncbi:hypothetical protein V512_001705 [Mesotoga sp. Brook.08.105.5.1]|nr:hypothetical protein V512_001705 [Mesotoga sp. Brook.08.105.5.1]RAO98217.1 hypothetical protein M388_07730 [Mesotoga sp. Brook.08.YT.4.2.5.4.]
MAFALSDSVSSRTLLTSENPFKLSLVFITKTLLAKRQLENAITYKALEYRC